MIFVAAVHRPVQAPARERIEPGLPVAPVLGSERCIRKTAGVQHELLDRDDIFTVRAELGDDVGHSLIEPKIAGLKQQPHRRRDDGLRAR